MSSKIVQIGKYIYTDVYTLTYIADLDKTSLFRYSKWCNLSILGKVCEYGRNSNTTQVIFTLFFAPGSMLHDFTSISFGDTLILYFIFRGFFITSILYFHQNNSEQVFDFQLSLSNHLVDPSGSDLQLLCEFDLTHPSFFFFHNAT